MEIGMNSWTQYIREGRQYLKAARNGRGRRHIFNNELLSNLVGLSVEKLLVGLCLHHGHMPADHTLSGIVAEVNSFCRMEKSLSEAVEMADRLENLCSLEVGASCTVNDRQIEQMIAMNEQIASFVESNLARPAAHRAV